MLIIDKVPCVQFAGVAQLAEQLTRNEQVVRSNRITSSNRRGSPRRFFCYVPDFACAFFQYAPIQTGRSIQRCFGPLIIPFKPRFRYGDLLLYMVSIPRPFYRMKFVLWNGSFSGRPYCSLPRAMLFIKKAILRARVRIVCRPSASCAASPGAVP